MRDTPKPSHTSHPGMSAMVPTVAEVDRGSTFALRRSTLDVLYRLAALLKGTASA